MNNLIQIASAGNAYYEQRSSYENWIGSSIPDVKSKRFYTYLYDLFVTEYYNNEFDKSNSGKTLDFKTIIRSCDKLLSQIKRITSGKKYINTLIDEFIEIFKDGDNRHRFTIHKNKLLAWWFVYEISCDKNKSKEIKENLRILANFYNIPIECNMEHDNNGTLSNVT